MAALEADGLVGDIEANRAQVIIQLWHCGEDFLRHLEANGLCNAPRQERSLGDNLWKSVLYPKSGAFIKFYTVSRRNPRYDGREDVLFKILTMAV